MPKDFNFQWIQNGYDQIPGKPEYKNLSLFVASMIPVVSRYDVETWRRESNRKHN